MVLNLSALDFFEIYLTGQTISSAFLFDTRHLKIAVYGKPLTSDTLFALFIEKTQNAVQTLCLTTETWWLTLDYFSAHVA